MPRLRGTRGRRRATLRWARRAPRRPRLAVAMQGLRGRCPQVTRGNPTANPMWRDTPVLQVAGPMALPRGRHGRPCQPVGRLPPRRRTTPSVVRYVVGSLRITPVHAFRRWLERRCRRRCLRPVESGRPLRCSTHMRSKFPTTEPPAYSRELAVGQGPLCAVCADRGDGLVYKCRFPECETRTFHIGCLTKMHQAVGKENPSAFSMCSPCFNTL